jgi:hypothetical protein
VLQEQARYVHGVVAQRVLQEKSSNGREQNYLSRHSPGTNDGRKVIVGYLKNKDASK